jgi:hypothetical protein
MQESQRGAGEVEINKVLWWIRNRCWGVWFRSSWKCQIPFWPRILILFIHVSDLAVHLLIGIPTWDTKSSRPMIQMMDGIRMGVSPKNTKIVSCPILLIFPVGVVLMGPKDDWRVFRMQLTINWDWVLINRKSTHYKAL